MLDQTILRRILLTAGSGVLSTTAPAGFAAGFAAGGAGGLAAGGAAGSPGGEPPALLGKSSWSSGLSTL